MRVVFTYDVSHLAAVLEEQNVAFGAQQIRHVVREVQQRLQRDAQRTRTTDDRQRTTCDMRQWVHGRTVSKVGGLARWVD